VERSRNVRRRWLWRRPWLVLTFAALIVGGAATVATATIRTSAVSFEVQSLDGNGNNQAHPTWGKLGLPYSRVAPANYADGRSRMVTGPNVRYLSNREFNDVNQNIFSERAVTQWVWLWGQWIDHNVGLAQGGGPVANIPFNAHDPLETFTNTLGSIPFTRDAAAPGTGVSNARQQVNTLSSYIDGFSVYSGSPTRLEWLRDGSIDGNPANNAATLMLPGGYLPTRDQRGDPATAPDMAIDGRLRANPDKAAVAGDVRGNENIALTATHTLFAREHNRIVSMLPSSLTAEQKFQIARRVVIAEIQFVTYNEFLPAMGVTLPAYNGYNPNVNVTLSNEFATVGYRAHSQIHGEIEVETDADRYTQAQLDAFAAAGIKVEDGEEPGEIVLAIPLNVAFFNPELLKAIGEGPVLQAMGLEPQYKNDALIDNHLRSVLFQVPKPGSTTCIEPVDPDCFTGVVDLGAIDVQRGRDHGMPDYNDLRAAYGLPRKASFSAIVNGSENFPADPKLTPGHEIDDPDSLDFTALFDIHGNPIPFGTPEANSAATSARRRTGLAARLKAIYGSVDRVDAFAGMVAEPHVPGTEMGELQRAIWTRQFRALRDGDRFFYANQPVLGQIRSAFGIDFRHTLAQIIAANTDIPASELNANVFVTGAGAASADNSPDGQSVSASGREDGPAGATLNAVPEARRQDADLF
jgi:hypothetical protein